MGDLARNRLKSEHRDFKRERPYGFAANPVKNADGSTNLMEWVCEVMPRKGSPYELPAEGSYRVILKFPADYPIQPPVAFFSPVIFHTNVFASGSVCLSLLLEAGHHKGTVQSHWTPDLTIMQILQALQMFLDEPNPNSIANAEACELYKKNKPAFQERVRKAALKYEADLEATLAKAKAGKQ